METLKKHLSAIAVVVCTLALFVAVANCIASCTPQQRAVARTAIDIGTALCILGHSDSSDQEIKTICGIVDAFDEPTKELLKKSREEKASARQGGARVAAGFCNEKDGGK